MKKWIAVISFSLFTLFSQAQFTRARLQATGLTCAMCSNAIHKALQKLPSVESVQADIKNSAFDIVFKKEANVHIEDLRRAVEDAGFFVGGLQLTGNFNAVKIDDEEKLVLGKNQLLFMNVGKQTLSGEKTLRVLNKEFVTAKEYKRYSAGLQKRLQQAEKEKVFLVTI